MEIRPISSITSAMRVESPNRTYAASRTEAAARVEAVGEVERAENAQRREETLKVAKAVESINQSSVFGEKYELTFIMDRESKRPLLRLIDRETKEVIKQFPPEYAIRLAKDLKAG